MHGDAARLVALLASHDQPQVEAARARLTILGPRAVPALLDLLEGGGEGARECAMEILSLIRDPRAREPIVAQLLDRTPRIRIAAARALAAFPARRTLAPLEKVFRADANLEVRVAAACALISLFEAGFEEAIRGLLDVLSDRGADRSVRRAAAGVLALLRPKERRDVLERLSDDPDLFREISGESDGPSSPGILAGSGSPDAPGEPGSPPSGAAARGPRAGAPARSGRAARGGRPDMERWIGDLAAPAPNRWNSALEALTALGSPIIEPLVAGMVWRCDDPVYCTRAGMVLRGLGARRLRPIADYLERVDEPLPLETLVDIVGELDDKPLVYRLKDLIVRLRALELDRSLNSPSGQRYDRVIAKAHLQLARIGSRVAVDDLKDALRSPHRALQIELLAAVELIGKKDDLADLMHAWVKGDDWMRARIREVFQSVMRRERVRRTNRLFAALSQTEQEAFAELARKPAHRGLS